MEISTKELIKKANDVLFDKCKIPHQLSLPVLYKENDKYCLAVFAFFYDKYELEIGYIDRPSIWALIDIKSGDILSHRACIERDFSDASHKEKYDIGFDKDKVVLRSYYEELYNLLDNIREDIIKTNSFNKAEYENYLSKILFTIPEEYQQFYTDLSI